MRGPPVDVFNTNLKLFAGEKESEEESSGFLSSEEGEINGFEAGEDYEKSRDGPV